jgi:hypothetical protein
MKTRTKINYTVRVSTHHVDNFSRAYEKNKIMLKKMVFIKLFRFILT